jgi:hypothetical protein
VPNEPKLPVLGLTTPQVSLDATDRSVAPLRGFRRWASTRPVSRPGLLAATRTRLTPASDDEVTNQGQLHRFTSRSAGRANGRG